MAPFKGLALSAATVGDIYAIIVRIIKNWRISIENKEDYLAYLFQNNALEALRFFKSSMNPLKAGTRLV